MLPVYLVLTVLFVQQPEIDPQAVEWFRKGEALIGTPDAYSAKQAGYFEKAVEVAPDFTAARYNLSLIYLHLGRLPDALAQLDSLVKLEPSKPRAFLLRIEVYLETDRLASAESDIEKILELDPRNPSGWHLRGQLHLRRKEYEEALVAFREAQQLDPEDPNRLFDLAFTLQNLGRREEAIGLYRSFLERFPDDFDAHRLLAAALRDVGEKEGAVEHFLRAETLRKGDPEIRRELAYLYLELGKLDEAERWLRMDESQSVPKLANLGVIARQQNRLVDAEFYFRQALQKAPEDGSLWAHLGDVLYRRGDERQAGSAYGRAVDLGVSDHETFLNLGTIHANMGETEQAAKDLKQALELNPRSAAAHFHLALVLERLENPDSARSHYLAALEDGAIDARIHFRLAVLFAGQGEQQLALEHLEEAFRKEPEKYVPIMREELRNVHSPFDSIRYTAAFTGLLEKYGSAEKEP